MKLFMCGGCFPGVDQTTCSEGQLEGFEIFGDVQSSIARLASLFPLLHCYGKPALGFRLNDGFG